MKIITDNQISSIQSKLRGIREAVKLTNDYLEIVSKGMPDADKEIIARLSKSLSDAEISANQIGKELEILKKPDSN